jgi:hypothetical protein
MFQLGKEPYMRLLALLPDLWIMARPVAQISAIVFFLAGCSALERTASSVSSQFLYGGPIYHPNGPMYADPSKVYLTGPALRELPTKVLDRYGCASGAPLACERRGRLDQISYCRC